MIQAKHIGIDVIYLGVGIPMADLQQRFLLAI